MNDQDNTVQKIEEMTSGLLSALGENAARDGLRDTPNRVGRMWQDMTVGYSQTVEGIIKNAIFDIDYDEMVVVRDIKFYSLCEHHLLPFYGKAHVAYIPGRKVVGLSKIPRIVDMFARRLQVQERLTTEIAEALQDALNPRGIAVVMQGKHLCMAMRGVQKDTASMVTSKMIGVFREDQRTRSEFLSLVDGV